MLVLPVNNVPRKSNYQHKRNNRVSQSSYLDVVISLKRFSLCPKQVARSTFQKKKFLAYIGDEKCRSIRRPRSILTNCDHSSPGTCGTENTLDKIDIIDVIVRGVNFLTIYGQPINFDSSIYMRRSSVLSCVENYFHCRKYEYCASGCGERHLG